MMHVHVPLVAVATVPCSIPNMSEPVAAMTSRPGTRCGVTMSCSSREEREGAGSDPEEVLLGNRQTLGPRKSNDLCKD